MARAWPLIHVCALAFVGAWFVGQYSGDAGSDFTRARVLTVRIAPNVVAIKPPPLTAKDIQRLRALTELQRPIIIERP